MVFTRQEYIASEHKLDAVANNVKTVGVDFKSWRKISYIPIY